MYPGAGADGSHRGGFCLHGGVLRTLCAITIQSQVVVLHHKALGSQVRQLARTLVNVIDRLTRAALKMMVVMVVGALKAGGIARQIDRASLPLFDQGFERPINGRDAHARHVLLGEIEHLLGQQGALRLIQGVFDGDALSGVSFHG